jgi:hypothetical protein
MKKGKEKKWAVIFYTYLSFALIKLHKNLKVVCAEFISKIQGKFISFVNSEQKKNKINSPYDPLL